MRGNPTRGRFFAFLSVLLLLQANSKCSVCGENDPKEVRARRLEGNEYFADLQANLGLTDTSGGGGASDGNLATPSPTKRPTKRPTRSPTKTPTRSPTKSPTLSPTKSPTRSPTKSPTKSPTSSPSRSPTSSPSSKPSKSPTSSPSSKPSRSPTSAPTRTPSVAPSDKPSSSPTSRPTGKPSISPTDSPTSSPSHVPTSMPSISPSSTPSASPTSRPTAMPSSSPSKSPSTSPTTVPTSQPSVYPTSTPSSSPSLSPTSTPSVSPTSTPSVHPTAAPSASPSDVPTSTPSVSPTAQPSSQPSLSSMPSSAPSAEPSSEPSAAPSSRPTITTETVQLSPFSIKFDLEIPGDVDRVDFNLKPEEDRLLTEYITSHLAHWYDLTLQLSEKGIEVFVDLTASRLSRRLKRKSEEDESLQVLEVVFVMDWQREYAGQVTFEHFERFVWEVPDTERMDEITDEAFDENTKRAFLNAVAGRSATTQGEILSFVTNLKLSRIIKLEEPLIEVEGTNWEKIKKIVIISLVVLAMLAMCAGFVFFWSQMGHLRGKGFSPEHWKSKSSGGKHQKLEGVESGVAVVVKPTPTAPSADDYEQEEEKPPPTTFSEEFDVDTASLASGNYDYEEASVMAPPSAISGTATSMMAPPSCISGVDTSIMAPSCISGAGSYMLPPPSALSGMDNSVLPPPSSLSGLDNSVRWSDRYNKNAYR